MKFRMDFVTNSSSTGYVAVHIETKDGNIECEDCYDTGFGGMIYNYASADSIRDKLNEVTNGEEFYDALTHSIEAFEYFDKDAIEKIKSIKSRDEILTITLDESTSFDEGPDHLYHFAYDFKKKKITKYEERDEFHHANISESEVDKFIRTAIDRFGENFFFDLHEYFLDGYEANIWSMKDFNKWWNEEEKAEVFKYFDNNKIHYSMDEAYISPLHGTSNNRVDLIDYDALLASIMDNEMSQESFIEKYDDYLY